MKTQGARRASRPLACLSLALCLHAAAFAQDKPPAQDKRPVEVLAAQLVAAQTEGERAALLDGRKELVGVELRKAVVALGDAHRSRAEFQQALAAYRVARFVAERAGDREGVARALHNSGLVHMVQGEFPAALDWFARSLAVKEPLGDKRDIARTLYNVAGVHAEQGNFAEALKIYQRTLELREAVGDKMGIGDSLIGLGLVYDAQHNYPLALEFFRKSLPIFEEIGDKEGMAYAFNNIANMLNARGEHAQALENFQKSLALLEGLKMRRPVGQALHNIGNVHEARKEYALALDFYRRSLRVKEEIGDRAGQANSLLNIGQVLLTQGEHAGAVEHATRSADIARQIFRRDTLWAALAAKGSAHLRLGQPEEARAALEESVAVIEELRSLVAGGEQDRQLFFENKVSPYLEMLKLLVGQRRHAEALAYAERSKARVLLEVLRGGRAHVDKALTAEERSRERELTGRLVKLNGELAAERQSAKPERARLDELTARLESARHEFAAFKTALYSAHPELKTRRGESQPLALDEAAELLRDSRDALVEFAVADDKTFLFVSTKGEAGEGGKGEGGRASGASGVALRVYEIGLKRGELLRRAQGFREQLAARGLGFRRQARELYDLLLSPAQAQLRGRTRLLVVPDAGLWELPFQALLTTDGRFLIEESEIAYAQSLTVLREMSRARARRRDRISSSTTSPLLLAFGNPSAGGSAAARGAGVIGMTWALFVAGSPATLVSQWKVEESSTTELMLEFHRRFRERVRGGRDAETAAGVLRSAALKLLRDGKSAHPFYWAGFVLVGDGR